MVAAERYKTELDVRLAVLGKDDSLPYGRGPIHVECLYHKNDTTASLAVYPDGVHCFACGANKAPLQFLADYYGLNLYRAFDQVTAVADALIQTAKAPRPKSKQCAAPDLTDIRAKAQRYAGQCDVEYFRKRGISRATIETAMLGHTGRAHSIPIFDPAGNVVWLKYRRDDTQDATGPKYWSHAGLSGTYVYYPPVFAGWKAYNGPIILVEGELDSLILAQYGVPAVTTNNGVRAIKNVVANLADGYKGIVLALDQDSPGAAGRAELVEILAGLGVPHAVVSWDCALGKDASEMIVNGHKERLLSLLRDAYRKVKQ